MSATRATASAPRSVVGIVLTLIAVVLLSAGPARAAFPGPNGRIAFSADQTSSNQIFSVNSDGTGLSGALTSESANSIGARWSPDGSKLVGASYASGHGQIYVVNADGSGLTNVSNNAFYDQAPSWSPDGSKIVFERLNASYNAGVYVMNADGSGQTQITAIPSGGFSVGDFNPVWSPNGAKIAFTRYVQGNNLAQIYTMNPDGASQTNITNSSTSFSDGANWSPDSTHIVFSASKPMSSDTDIFVMNADGTSQTNLTNTTATNNLEPTFSPDGTQIAFVREPNTANQHYDLFVIGANGSGAKDITNTPTVDERAPDWGRAPAVVKPTVDSVSASAVGTSGATLDGHVGPGGEAASWHFEYDTVASGAYRSSTTGGVTTSANVTEAVRSVLTGLAPSTKYQFRLVASNSAGTTTVDGGTFTTSGPPPMAVTLPPSHVGSTTMDLAGYVNDAGGLDTHYYFQWGLNDGNWHNHSPADPGQDIGSTATLSGHHELAVATLTGLQPNTTYCFRLVAYNSAGVTYADDANSNPPTAVGMCRRTAAAPIAPGVLTGGASSPSTTSLHLAGTVNPEGDGTTTWFFQYSIHGDLSKSGGGATSRAEAGEVPLKDPGAGLGFSDLTPHPVGADVPKLTPGTTYWYRLVAKNTAGYQYGDRSSFPTTSNSQPAGPSNGGRYAIQGVEVNQGTQDHRLDPANANAVASYTGVPLAAGKTTVVRVYVAATKPVVASLRGIRGGQDLGTIAPSTSLAPDLTAVGASQPAAGCNGKTCNDKQTDPRGGFLFSLPARWIVGGNLTLVASVRPTDAVVGSSGGCGDCREFTLQHIPVQSTQAIKFKIVALADQSGQYPDLTKARAYFQIASQLLPEGSGHVINDSSNATFWAGQIVVSGSQGSYAAEDAGTRYIDAQNELRKWASVRDHATGDYVLGISNDPAVGATDHSAGPFEHSYGLSGPLSTASIADGPLTDMLHEMYHGFGQPHSQTVTDDRLCYSLLAHQSVHSGTDLSGSGSDPRGLFDGVGLDLLDQTPAGGHPVIGFGTAPFYDIMSYCSEHSDYGDITWARANATPQWPSEHCSAADVGCAAPTLRQSHSWLDPREWRKVFPLFVAGASSSPNRRSANARGAASLAVEALDDGTGVHIVSVIPVAPGAPAPAASNPAYRLAARDAAGGTLLDSAMSVQSVEAHLTTEPTLLTAVVPAGTQSLTISHNGTVVATLTRSAHAPTVTITAPSANAHVDAHGKLTIAWQAGDADNNPLDATVDYSRNGGATWQGEFTGPSHGHVSLPAASFPRSTNARVRVTVSDGFNTTTTESARFISPGAPPQVQINAPRVGQLQIAAGQPLLVTETATDDRGQPLTGSRLRWFLGGRRVGSGSQLTLHPSRPGRVRVRLSATDRFGRISTATATARVIPVTPELLTASPARRLTRRSRVLVLRVIANVPCHLRVGRQSFSLTGGPRRIRIRVRPGRHALKLTLRLNGGGRHGAQKLTVLRG